MASPRHFVTDPDRQALPTGENLCLLCAKQNITCCRTEPYLAPLCFPLSAPEWRRLLPYKDLAVLAVPADGETFAQAEAMADAKAALLAKERPEAGDLEAMPEQETPGPLADPPEQGDEICARELNVPEFINSMREMFPREKKRLTALFPSKGKHFTLRLRSDGSCVFLGKGGCRLPRGIRPWYCRIFPAWVVGESLTLFLLQDCLISHRAKGPAEGVRMLGASPRHIRMLHARLCEDWGLQTNP